MRKREQQQILELLRTIGQAQAAGLLAGCREGALSIGSFIESVEGADNPRIASVIALLSEYCDLLCAASKGEASEKRLRRQLIEIENRVRSELTPDRIEVVFLPYQYSMFDALESVYRAAAADPACDARVMPIPWYELNPGGSPGRLRCDGGEYPADIPVTDYRAYDIEARRPDAIFVHNPYDGGNLVTRVHEDFYCERLRGLTELLVYIPYFVTYGDVPEHFCTVAGCVYAHRVILQSEAVRDTYVRVFKAAYGDSFGKPEEKFMALGSPKFDKVLSTRREDCALPERWRRLIAGRKTVLYNTSVGALLAGDERYLTKLKHVLDTFKNRGDIALWWRPHPLNEATCKSMRPGLLKAYKKIVAEYRLEGAGIYDDTQDLHRAVALTDAYYGDPSSLAALYGMTGRPIMIGDANVLPALPGGEREDALLFESCYDDGTHIWFAAYFFNGLFRCDKETWTAEYLGAFPEEKPDGVRLYSGVAECLGKLYFAPYAAKAIAVYDTESGAFGRISLPAVDGKMQGAYSPFDKFGGAVAHGNDVFLIPGTYPAIIRIDARTDAPQCIADWLPKIQKIKNDDHSWFFYGTAIVNGKLFIASCYANAVAVLDTERLTCEVFALGNNADNYNGICYDGAYFWLAPRRAVDGAAALLKWGGASRAADTELVEVQAPKDCAYMLGKPPDVFRTLLYLDGYVYAIPQYLDAVYKADVRTKEVSVCEAFRSECAADESPALFDKFSFAWQNGHTLYAQGSRDLRVSEYDTATGSFKATALRGDTRQIVADAYARRAEYIEEFSDCLYAENAVCGLAEYLEHIMGGIGPDACAKQRECAKAAESNAGTAGGHIYDCCKRLLLDRN